MKPRTFLTLTLELALTAILAMAQTAPARPAANSSAAQVDSVIKLVKAGLSESTIIMSIKKTNKPADLSAADMIKLKEAGVSENIILTMMDPTFVAPAAPAAAPAPAPAPAQTEAPPPPPPPAPDPVPSAPPPPAPVAAPAPAPAGDWKAAIQSRLAQQFPLTQATADKTDIVTAGAVLILKKGPLAMYPNNSFSNMSTYSNGQINNGMSGRVCGAVSAKHGFGGMIGGIAGGSAGKCRMFVRGEKFWLVEVEVKEDGAILRFMSDPLPDARYLGQLRIPFARGTTPAPDQVAAQAAELLDVDATAQPQPAVNGPAPGAPPAPAPPPTPAAPAQQTFSDPPPPPPPPDASGAAPAAPPAPATPTGSVNLGQSPADVVAAMGQPDKIATVGTKQIYTYKNLKVTFIDGKVTDVQ